MLTATGREGSEVTLSGQGQARPSCAPCSHVPCIHVHHHPVSSESQLGEQLMGLHSNETRIDVSYHMMPTCEGEFAPPSPRWMMRLPKSSWAICPESHGKQD